METMLSEITPPSESSTPIEVIVCAESNVLNKTKVLNPMSTEPANIADSTETMFSVNEPNISDTPHVKVFDSSITEQNTSESPIKKPRKRVRHHDEWKDLKRKRLKDQGQAYQSRSGK